MTLKKIKEKHLSSSYTPDPRSATFCLDEAVLDEMLAEAYMAGHRSIRGEGGAKEDHYNKFIGNK